MGKRRVLSGNRVVTKGNPVKDRIVRTKRRDIDTTVQSMIDGPALIKPFRGRYMDELGF